MKTQSKSTNESASGKQKRAAIYVRTAAPQEPGEKKVFSLECCKQYCAEYGYTVRHVYQEVYSGAQYHERPQLSALRAAAREGACDVVVVYSYDRLSRKPEHLETLIKELEPSGVSIVSMTENAGVRALAKEAHALVADIERDRLRRRMQHGKQQGLQQHGLSGE